MQCPTPRRREIKDAQHEKRRQNCNAPSLSTQRRDTRGAPRENGKKIPMPLEVLEGKCLQGTKVPALAACSFPAPNRFCFLGGGAAFPRAVHPLWGVVLIFSREGMPEEQAADQTLGLASPESCWAR